MDNEYPNQIRSQSLLFTGTLVGMACNTVNRNSHTTRLRVSHDGAAVPTLLAHSNRYAHQQSSILKVHVCVITAKIGELKLSKIAIR